MQEISRRNEITGFNQMTKSMTAFARAQSGNLVWEIRSVNQRYLEPVFKLPENIRLIEPELRTLLKSKLARGKVDCGFRWDSSVSGSTRSELNDAELRHVTRLVDQVSAISNNVAKINPLELLRWPSVLQEESDDPETQAAEIRELFVTAVDSLVAMREREGAELERVILARLDNLAKIAAEVRFNAPIIKERLATRLKERIAEIAVEPDSDRLEQELVYMAQKSDVYEELDRLDTHIEEVRSTLKSDEAIGRRLDFLMQELNREANTLSSKSSTADMSTQAVELKVIIEQMREQVQNIE